MKTPFKQLEPLFTIGNSWQAFTLSDKQCNEDTWGLHWNIAEAAEAGQPTGVPLAYIITAHKPNTPPVQEPFAWKAGAQDKLAVHMKKNNPAPANSTRQRYRFEYNTSRDWSSDKKACADFPWHMALANYFYWHTAKRTIITFAKGGSMEKRPAWLVAMYMGRSVFRISSPDDQEKEAKALQTVAYLSSSSQSRYTLSLCACLHLSNYPKLLRWYTSC